MIEHGLHSLMMAEKFKELETQNTPAVAVGPRSNKLLPESEWGCTNCFC